jgi:hypothetical protein
VNASQLDSLQSEIDRSTAAELRRVRAPLVKLLAGDALQPAASGGTVQAVALQLLGALVAVDDGTAIANEVHAQGIPRSILDSLSTSAHKVLLQPSHKAQVRHPPPPPPQLARTSPRPTPPSPPPPQLARISPRPTPPPSPTTPSCPPPPSPCMPRPACCSLNPQLALHASSPT